SPVPMSNHSTTTHAALTLANTVFSTPTPPPRTTTLFPYTTLFRSLHLVHAGRSAQGVFDISPSQKASLSILPQHMWQPVYGVFGFLLRRDLHCASTCDSARSEEHTSELQSRFDLVCRLLLEKKKHITYSIS